MSKPIDKRSDAQWARDWAALELQHTLDTRNWMITDGQRYAAQKLIDAIGCHDTLDKTSVVGPFLAALK